MGNGGIGRCENGSVHGADEAGEEAEGEDPPFLAGGPVERVLGAVGAIECNYCDVGTGFWRVLVDVRSYSEWHTFWGACWVSAGVWVHVFDGHRCQDEFNDGVWN